MGRARFLVVCSYNGTADEFEDQPSAERAAAELMSRMIDTRQPPPFKIFVARVITSTAATVTSTTEKHV